MRKHKPKAMEKYTMVIYLKAKYHHFNSLKIVLWIQYNFDNFHCNDKIDSIRYLFLKLARVYRYNILGSLLKQIYSLLCERWWGPM